MQEIYLQGNKGGDYIRIIQHKRQDKNCTCYIEVGCACVVTIRHEIPVELLTNLLTQTMLNANGMEKAASEIFSKYDKLYSGIASIILRRMRTLVQDGIGRSVTNV